MPGRWPSWPALALVLLLLWAPLPFASVTPLGLLIVRAGAFAALALALWPARRSLRDTGVAIPALALVAVALVGVLQAVPLPASWVGLLSPDRLRLAGEAARLSGAEVTVVPLSFAPSRSLSTALTLLAMAATLVAAALVGGNRRDRRWLLGAVLGAALFQLLYGFRHLAAGSIAVWGLDVGRDATRLRGTFVNPAHLAPYLEMTLAVAFALAWWAYRRVRRAESRGEWRWTLAALPVLAWLLLFAGLALTRSRAALVAAALGTVAQGIAVAAHHRRWRLVPIGLVALAAGFGLVAWTGLERGLGRLLDTSVHSVAAGARIEVWSASLGLWQRFPVLGTGLGSFESVFPMVESEGVAAVAWEHAHNDWLELLVTGGLLAALPLLVGLVALARRLWTRVSTSPSEEGAAAAVAGLGAALAVGFHELVDFGLTLPANAVTLAALLGVASSDDQAGSE